MKILFVSNLFPDKGSPNRGRDNSVMLRQLAKEAEVKVIAMRPTLGWPGPVDLEPMPEDAFLQPQYVRVPYIPRIGSSVNARLYAAAVGGPLRKLIASWRPDVVLVAWLFPDACAVARICATTGTPMVAIAQGTDVHGYLENPSRRRQIVAMVDNGAAAIITRSTDLAARLVHAGAKNPHLYAVRNGVDHTIFRPAADRDAVRQELQLPAKCPVVLFVGNFLPVKDPETLAEAFEIVAHAFPEAILAMCGDGPLRRKMAQDLARAEVLGQSRFEGIVDAGRVAKWMQAADVLVLTSLLEGTPNVIMEALSCGTPVVSTAVGGVGEILNSPYLGRTVPPENPEAVATAIASIIHEPPDRARIAKYAEQFHWDATIDAMIEIIDDVALAD